MSLSSRSNSHSVARCQHPGWVHRIHLRLGASPIQRSGILRWLGRRQLSARRRSVRLPVPRRGKTSRNDANAGLGMIRCL